MVSNPSAPQSTTARIPLVEELSQLFDTLPYDNLVARLQKIGGRGPKGYSSDSLFRAFIASYYLNHDCISDTVRALQDNPVLAETCGFDSGGVPSRPTLSRFFKRVSDHRDELNRILAKLTDQIRLVLPEFATNVAVDSSTVRTHSNPDRDPITDVEASWSAKGYRTGSGKKDWHFGYKLHLAVCADYELPVAAYVTTGKSADSLNLTPLLRVAMERHRWFNPSFVTADKGYDALHVYQTVMDEFDAVPVIPMRKLRPGAKKRRPNSHHRTAVNRESAAWKDIYATRTSVERVFGRLKERRRLERHCYRGLSKIETHCLMSVLTLQAKALVQIQTAGNLRACLRRVA